jgi:triacylglycerol lipase
MFVFFCCLAVVTALTVLDIMKKINLLHPLILMLYLPAALNVTLLGYWFYHLSPSALPGIPRTAFVILAGVFIFYLWIRLNVFPFRPKKRLRSGFSLTKTRPRIMMGGRFLCYAGLWAFALEIPLLIAGFFLFRGKEIPRPVFIANAVYGILCTFFLLGNGVARIFFTSRRLSVFWRLAMILTMGIPFVNIIVLLYVCRLVYEEYDFALYKGDLHLIRADLEICKTRYPLILVHGVLFRDLKYFNYWGRIPKELIRNGAQVYYGNQEAVGTIATNAEDLRDKIFEVLKETGAEKVNIIAHSKGGLDSRYAISRLGMADKVASLTTISTPHRGCRFVDKACGLPDGIYRGVANFFDRSFQKLGDKRPDFYTATRQFATADSEAFNQSTPDSPDVYYQSYMSKMKGPRSDLMLAVPWLMVKSLEGDNDGLVSVGSAVWGNFQGVLESKSRRGISHGDIIDLRRADYKGFDVIEAYIGIVAALKGKGF